MSDQFKLTRRDFLRTTAAAGAALGMGLYATAPAKSQVLGANDRINIGVIGCGGKGTGHLRALVDRAKNSKYNIAVIAVSDIYEPRKQRAKEISGAEVYHDYRKMLELKDLDAVLIATPDHWHAIMAIEAMKAGKDVYLEKPMTKTWQEAKEVAQTAFRENRILQVGAQSCSEDRWWKASDLIKKGALGKVLWSQTGYCRNSRNGEWNYGIDAGANASNLDWKAFIGPAPAKSFDPERFFRWRKYWDYSGGIATDLFYHQLSHMMVALGPEFPKRVVSSGGIYVQNDREVPDTFHAMIDYPSNHTVVLNSSMANRVGVQEIIRGHEATMYFEGPGIVIRPESEFQDQHPETRVEVEPRVGHLDNWLECLRTRHQPACNAQTGYKVMAAIALTVDSFRKDKVMLFDPKTERVVES